MCTEHYYHQRLCWSAGVIVNYVMGDLNAVKCTTATILYVYFWRNYGVLGYFVYNLGNDCKHGHYWQPMLALWFHFHLCILWTINDIPGKNPLERPPGESFHLLRGHFTWKAVNWNLRGLSRWVALTIAEKTPGSLSKGSFLGTSLTVHIVFQSKI